MADAHTATGRGRAAAPPRPSLVLPPRLSYDALVRGGAAWNASPGPMTLVSSFFEPETEHQSYSQLLAGAIASPAASGAPSEVAWSPFFTVPPGLSPGGLLNSPAFFGRFGMSHQEALAQVTAQARSNVNVQEVCASFAAEAASTAKSTSSASNSESFKEMPPPKSNQRNASSNMSKGSNLDEKFQNAAIPGDKPTEDGYNWRKYGQKQVKSSEYPRSYYKCTHPNCPVKKKIECNYEGEIIEIVYKGQHNHQQPSNNRRGKQGGCLQGGFNESKVDNFATTEERSDCLPKVSSRLNEPTSKVDGEFDGASDQLSDSSEAEEVADTDLRTDEVGDNEPEAKRRNTDNRVILSTSHRTLTEPKIILQTVSEVDLLDDSYRWRKYGQKVVKGNPNPRSYYKCTYVGCNVRKHIERAATDPKSVITTYEGKHNHDIPSGRKNSHVVANGVNRGAVFMDVENNMSSNQYCLNEQQLRKSNVQPITRSQLKEEF